MNGRVLVLGGSVEFHGAPLFSSQAVLNSGADLVTIAVPEVNFDVTRNFSPSFLVRKYPGEYLSQKAKEMIMALATNVDVVLIGPGLGDRPETLKTVKDLIEQINLPMVLDAHAIQALELVENIPLSHPLVITPHHYEFEKLTGKPFKITDPADQKTRLIRALANDLKMNILLKGPIDIIASDDGQLEENDTGNAGMTVGGSGDVLAGMVAGLMSQDLPAFEACQAAAFALGSAGDRLLKLKGYCFTAEDLLQEFPLVLKDLIE